MTRRGFRRSTDTEGDQRHQLIVCVFCHEATKTTEENLGHWHHKLLFLLNIFVGISPMVPHFYSILKICSLQFKPCPSTRLLRSTLRQIDGQMSNFILVSSRSHHSHHQYKKNKIGWLKRATAAAELIALDFISPCQTNRNRFLEKNLGNVRARSLYVLRFAAMLVSCKGTKQTQVTNKSDQWLCKSALENLYCKNTHFDSKHLRILGQILNCNKAWITSRSWSLKEANQA